MDFSASHPYRLTKIVCTLGPSSDSKERIRALADAGMNVARINVSHGSRSEHEALLKIIAEVNNETGYHIATLIDTRGAEIRTGDVQDPLEIQAGDTVLFAPASREGTLQNETQPILYVGYDGFADDVRETNRILVDNGEMSFAINSIDDGCVVATAEQAGSIGSRRHINLPGADIALPSITEKDWEDIAFAADAGVDFVALSFIRSADEIASVRTLFNDKQHHPGIITKVETQKAVENIAEITAASDGIMVARGDLGAEIPFEHLPVVQQEIIQRCRQAGKPVIVATHMLESMMEHPIPTRAEVTDVAHAAMQQSDATMLSGETASGKHPPLTVQAMDKILRATETQLDQCPIVPTEIHDDEDAYASAAVDLAVSTRAGAIFVFTRSGHTARALSRCRPHIPILTFSPDANTLHQVQLLYGTKPIQLDFTTIEDTVQKAMQLAVDSGAVRKQDRVVVVSDTPSQDTTVTSVQVRTIV